MENLKGQITLRIGTYDAITSASVSAPKPKPIERHFFGKPNRQPKKEEVTILFENGKDLHLSIDGFVWYPTKILNVSEYSNSEQAPPYFVFQEHVEGCTLGMVQEALDKDYDLSEFYEGKRGMVIANYLFLTPNTMQVFFEENSPDSFYVVITAKCECNLDRIIEDYQLMPLEQSLANANLEKEK
jgi:hypothetical protein